ncbi:MAG: replication factor C large subunit [Candidatus Nanoarchaeia archaeon]|nr:replication factor C large subunit [Candidatus Nanoarchaeia archaeon]MDD5740514.1 replication factor C large subunit [Candidatus Nanoarchaeia archaeon]
MLPKTLPLIEKYRVKKFSDIRGQDIAIQEVINFYKRFPMKKALILNGPVGTGKTSLVIALANEFNLELFELNASDLRNRLKLEEVLRPSIEQHSLFRKGKLILMDEADGITGTDRGGLPELIALIDKTSHPIIITANDIWDRKFNLLRKRCHLVSVNELTDKVILNIIKDILKKENKSLRPETIIMISVLAKGDVRAALNDLQTAISLGEQAFLEELSEREKEESIFNALKNVFQNKTEEKTIRVYDNTKLELDEILLWVEENIPSEYKGEALAKAYDSLSKADVFRGRIYRQQYWRFLLYQNFFLSAGISTATKLKYKKFTKYRKPSRILKIWLSNQKNAKKKSIIAKYSQRCHISKRKANKEAFLFPLIIDREANKRLDLDEKETEWLKERKHDMIMSNNLNRFA